MASGRSPDIDDSRESGNPESARPASLRVLFPNNMTTTKRNASVGKNFAGTLKSCSVPAQEAGRYQAEQDPQSWGSCSASAQQGGPEAGREAVEQDSMAMMAERKSRQGRRRVAWYVTMVMTMVTRCGMRTIKASEFKAKCLKIMDEVAETGESVVITKNGVPVAELVPVKRKPLKTLFGAMAGSMVITGDIISPVDVEWEALS